MIGDVTDEILAKRLRPGAGVPIDPEKLKWVRNARQLTKKQLSERIAEVAREQDIRDNNGELVTYTLDALAKLENGERKPKMYTFIALCAALKCESEDLLEDFPGTERVTSDRVLPTDEETAQLLSDSTDPVSMLDLTTRAWHSVERSGCQSVGELVAALHSGSLEKVKMLGFVQRKEIRRALAEHAADLLPAAENEANADEADDADAEAESGYTGVIVDAEAS